MPAMDRVRRLARSDFGRRPAFIRKSDLDYAQRRYRPAMIAVQQVVENQLTVTFTPASHDRSLAGVLGKPPRSVSGDWREIRDATERAIAEEVG